VEVLLYVMDDDERRSNRVKVSILTLSYFQTRTFGIVPTFKNPKNEKLNRYQLIGA